MDMVGNEGRLLLRLMSAANLRQRVIADNIANESTPGFKRHVVRFEELLGAELDANSAKADFAKIEPRVDTDLATPAGPDGNNVNLELENASMRENRLLYEAYASILEARTGMIRASITEGR